MSVLKKLNLAANYDPSKERKDLTISKLCQEIENGQMVLPIFQTYIRWPENKAVELFNYQLLAQSPVAPISINEIKDPAQVITQISFIDRSIIEDEENLSGKYSVVDGQQRLSTNYKAYTNHPDFKNIVLDLKKGKFVLLRPQGNELSVTPDKHQIPVGILYNKDHKQYLDYVNSSEYLKTDEIKDLLNSIRKKHEQYYYVVNFAVNLTKDEQMEWFEVLNLAGSQVTDVMVYLTDLLVKGVDFYTDYSMLFSKKLEDSGFYNLIPRKSAEISIPLATLNAAYFKVTGLPKTKNYSPIPSDAKPKAIGKCTVTQVRKMFEETLNSLDEVLEFIENQNLREDIDKIDIITYLVGLYVEKDVKFLDDEQSKYVIEFIKDAHFVNDSNTERRRKFEVLLQDFPN